MYNSYSALNLLGGMLYTVILLVVAYFVLKIVANWKIFEKAGQPGWASIVPFYSNYIEFNIYWGNGWLFLIPVLLSLLSGIPLLGNLFLVVALIIGAITNYKKAVAFGEGIGFTIGLCLLNPVFNMILAFGHYEYHGIPQDGYSYSQLKTKYEEKKAEQQNNPSTVQYQAPETPKEPSQNVQYQTPNAPDIIWVVVFLCVLIASCFGMYYFQGENKQKFVFCFLLVALSFGVLAFRLLDIAYTVINAAIKAA